MQPNDSNHCEVSAQHLTATVLPPVLITELLFGIPGNLIALYIFCHCLQSWRPNIIFLFNLMVADFFLLVSLPFRIDTYLRSENWVFGDAWCRINLFMLAINRSASIGFMTVVAVDRYFKIVHPHHKVNFISSWQAGVISSLIWTVVISLRLPLLTTNLLVENNNISLCRSFSAETTLVNKLHQMIYIGEFFFPLVILLFCSIRISCILSNSHMNRQKKVQRAVRTVLVIVGVFIICFLPGVSTGLIALSLKKLGPEYCNAYKLTGQLFTMSIGFTYLNSALDPVIYCFTSSMFRNAVKKSINRTGIVEFQLSRHGSTIGGSEG